MLTFDRKLARLFLEICRYTYAEAFSSGATAADRQDALAAIRQAGAPDALVMLNDGKTPSTSVACVAAYPDRNVVSYMGTKTEFHTPQEAIDSIRDWGENLEALLVPFRLTAEQLGQDHPARNDLGGRVHNGFLEQLALVQAQVVAELMRRGGRGRPLYVTGHSQGGAEAALATRAFLAGGFPLVATYTFAAPRPGNAAFVASVPPTFPVHRIEFGDDIVPHVPPTMIGREARVIIQGLTKIPLLPDHVDKVLALLVRATDHTAFAGLGRLCYGNPHTKALRVDILADEEAAMFTSRVMGLVAHPGNWAEHHHLAGTSVDVKNGVKGNYTALVSDYTMVA